MGMESKAQLVTKTGEYKNSKQVKEEKQNDIQLKKAQLESLQNRFRDLTNIIASQ